MKTSVIEVSDILTALGAHGVEKRIGEVPGVESATVDEAAGSATVRYDETRLDIADIKAAVHQSGSQTTGGESRPKDLMEHKPVHELSMAPTPQAAPAPASTSGAGASTVPSGAPAAEPAASAGGGHEGHAAPGAPSTTPATASPNPPVKPAAGPAPTPAAPISPPDAPTAVPAPAAPAVDDQEGHPRSTPGARGE